MSKLQSEATASQGGGIESAEMAIQKLVEEGLRLIRDDPQHDLKLSFRRRLWPALDGIGTGAPAQIGHIRRVRLATLAVEKVLPLWEALLPEDRAPHQSLEVVREVVDGTVTTAAADRIAGEVWTHCDNLAWKHANEDQSVIMAGYAAARTIWWALSDQQLSSSSANADIEVDPYDHTVIYCRGRIRAGPYMAA
jgi:hypothetical protein